MTRLILHIGYNKTGTTSLQAFFAANAAALRANGILYPETGRIPGRNAHYGINLALGIADAARPADIPRPTGLQAALAAEVAASGCTTVIISSEFLVTSSQADIAAVKTFFAGYDVRILCYLRRHDHAFESAYAQSIKTTPQPPWMTGIESFILFHMGTGRPSYDYAAVLHHWAHHFGRDALIVRPYEAAQNQPDIHADFLAASGLPDHPDYTRPRPLNPSISPRTAAAIALLGRAALPEATRKTVIARLVAAEPRDIPRQHTLAAPLRAALVRRYQPIYRTIARTYLARPDGILFTEPLPTTDPAPQTWSDTDLIETILAALTRHLPSP